MKKLILLLLFVVAACGTQMIDPPERLIEKDKFVNILFDLTLYNGIRNHTTPVFSTQELRIMPYLYSKYDFDSVQFFESNLYYASRGDLYLAMFDTVRARIERTEQLMDSLRKLPPPETLKEIEN